MSLSLVCKNQILPTISIQVAKETSKLYLGTASSQHRMKLPEPSLHNTNETSGSLKYASPTATTISISPSCSTSPSASENVYAPSQDQVGVFGRALFIEIYFYTTRFIKTIGSQKTLTRPHHSSHLRLDLL